MPKNSGQQGNRSIGLDHQNGKGDKTRVTDVQAYRANFDEIDWGRPCTPINIFEHCPPKSKLTFKRVRKLAKKLSALVRKEGQLRLRTLREIEDEEFAWRHGL